MNINEIIQLPLEGKTLAQLHLQIKSQAHHFSEKYERCFRNKRYSLAMMHFYRKAKETYFEFNELLYHLDRYNSISNDSKCLSCRLDMAHVRRLEDSFNRYRRIIAKCKDGWRFDKLKVLHHDL